jgi:hypothetical protein
MATVLTALVALVSRTCDSPAARVVNHDSIVHNYRLPASQRTCAAFIQTLDRSRSFAIQYALEGFSMAS